jgi:hypothetical protein
MDRTGRNREETDPRGLVMLGQKLRSEERLNPRSARALKSILPRPEIIGYCPEYACHIPMYFRPFHAFQIFECFHIIHPQTDRECEFSPLAVICISLTAILFLYIPNKAG